VAVIALAVFVAMALAAVLAPWIAPQDPYDLMTVSIIDNLMPPGEQGFPA
jgi:peptide/nickel transport system permease protein